MPAYPDPAAQGLNIASDADFWTRLLRDFNGRRFYVCSPDWGADRTGVADSGAAINACIAASSPKDWIIFHPGTYSTSIPIIRETDRVYFGMGMGWNDGVILKARNGSSANFQNASGHSGVFVPKSWNTNATVAAGREAVIGFAVDGNRANNATGQHHGIILHGNFWSHYEKLHTYECRREGIHLTPYGKDGTTSMATGVSDLVLRDIMSRNNTGSGIYNRQHSVSGAYLSDVVLDGSIVLFSNDGSGLISENSGGWALDGTVHQWQNGKHGVVLEQAYGARIGHVYGEDMGRLGTSGEFLFGLKVVANNGRDVFVHDCMSLVSAPVSGVTHIGISIETNDTDVHIWAHDLGAQCISGAGGANEYGFQLWKGNSSGNILKLHSSGGLHARGFQDRAHRWRIEGNGSLLAPDLVMDTDANIQTGTSYTFAVQDMNGAVEFTNAGTVTATVPAGIFSAGSFVEIARMGAGAVNVVAGAGMTLRAPGGLLSLASQYSTAGLRFRSSTEAVVAGDLA